ncbi:two-pore potassium channel 1-like [Olea europaea var. sylvestris]|uniref:two-pore potassium channel 1-like n=1 Tax=Olea europaea var. sylvestris TaxID=158386 RepID=UPI000C1D1CF3|nr:two-pore potassium channel 1-like [Olea europaea var. sylvestris]XP_022886447.1 two-pore potassium channel 1-like [Olea europaea var. sylvestris]
MANRDVEDPLLAEPVDSSRQSNGNNSLKRRKYRRSRSIPTEDVCAGQTSVESLQHPESIFGNKIHFKQVLALLSAYLGVGVFCFFLVRDQIKGQKTNVILDAVYFCVVTMTTVGYGDLVPDSILSKLLACIFVFMGMALVGFLLSKAADYIVEKQETLLVKAIHMREKYSANDILKEVETNKVEYKFLTALIFIIILIVIGSLFLYGVEGLNLFDAFYCVCATITTLGYGDKSFSTYAGRIFASFWILISTICLAQFFYCLAELYTERRRRSLVKWVLTRKLTISDLEAADLDNDKVVSAAEFVVFKLKELGKISEEDIDMVMEGFKSLDVDQSGTLTKADLVNPESPNS